MKRHFISLTGIGALNLILFFGTFLLLQQEKIYHATLGLISENYERVGGWDNYEIVKVAKPFVELKNDNFENWDAVIYKCISERMYTPEGACYGNIRAAFFPLFPILWKITGSSFIGISIINYIIFMVSVALLVMHLLKTTLFNRVLVFTILITIPSAVVYYIPYSESLFLLTMTMAVIGVLKNKYGLFFAGSLLLAMVRPATVFILIAIILAELPLPGRNVNFRTFLKQAALKSLPFIIGYGIALFIQYASSGSWTALLHARKSWQAVVSFTDGFSDWSVEGFGLAVFAIFFVCLPALGYIVYLLSGKKRIPACDFFGKSNNEAAGYLAVISALYLIGIFVFTLFTQGLNMHSFSRYALGSPPFYISVLLVLNYLSGRQIKMPVLIYLGLTFLTLLFLNFVDYGGEKMQFSFLGLYLFMATGFFLIIKNNMSHPAQIAAALVLVFLNTVWNNYLLNMFFSNAWTFT